MQPTQLRPSKLQNHHLARKYKKYEKDGA